MNGTKHSEPEHLRHLGARTWWATLKRTVREFQDDELMDRAAALTYYGVLALFPALIALVSIVGLFGDPQAVTDTITEVIEELAPGSASDTLQDTIEGLTQDRGAAGVLLVLGILGALNAASGYIGAFIRASNVIYEVQEGRPFYKLRPLQLAVTIVIVSAVGLVIMALVLSGPLAGAVGDAIGLSEEAVTAYGVA
ncbi:MAG TPA: YihY/virulence factor BrkB family protein, partial [Thermoleophilaceae bacterium]|nr:YihY/virulence factor BrkB family protein [Thermoleophilaceae bacterium]